MLKVVLASHNAHKLEELRRILSPLVPGLELLGYDGPAPVEHGVTFEENALIKARAAAEHSGLPAIADDSGIAIDVLGGSPGIFSARWAGPGRSDQANLELVLWQLSDVADEYRGAAFVCAAALAMPECVADSEVENASYFGGGDGRDIAVRTEWRGTILREPAGSSGFGYDPIFAPTGDTRSAAQLSPEEKDAVSHRRGAFTALATQIRARHLK